MTPEELRKEISLTFRGRDWERVGYLTLWWIHGLTNAFSEPLKKVLPWEVWFIGTDRNPLRLKLRKRPVGYWFAKIVTIFVLLFGFGFLGEISRAIVLALL